MQSLMQQIPLLISSILGHAARSYPNQTVISKLPEGGIHSYTYFDLDVRSRSLANVLKNLGVSAGDRVATLAWNTHRHLELFYAVSGSGAVLHTVNPRLFIEQIEYIVTAGGARVLFFDNTFLPLVEKLVPACTNLEVLVCLQGDRISGLDIAQYDYEELLRHSSPLYQWPQLDENAASSMCFTSGTTGNPKGVVYSHRSTLLHALVASHDNAFGLTCNDKVLPIAPMYHANAWAMPYICPLVGAGMVLPGDKMDAESLSTLINDYGVTFASAVPTIWKAMLDYLESTSSELPSLTRTMIGGTAVARSMLETFRDRYGVRVIQVWGMTETSPLGVACTPSPELARLSSSERDDILCEKQGRLQFGVELRLMGEDGQQQPADGKSIGHLQVRGPWIAGAYVGQSPGEALTNDGWFDTGDMATLDAMGYMKITDRSKDVIKSGGEWISSQDLENTAMGFEGVSMAAVVAVPEDRWDERPILVVVPKSDVTLREHELLGSFAGKVASWWIPDRVFIVDELPMTATGKVDKKVLREIYRDALKKNSSVPG